MPSEEVLKQELTTMIKVVREICRNQAYCNYCIFRDEICDKWCISPELITDEEIEEVFK